MAISNYTELKTALADWSHRSDLTSFLDDYIAQTEDFFTYEPIAPTKPGIGGIRANITRVDDTMTSGTDTLIRPTDFLNAFRLRITGSSGGNLEFVGTEQMSLEKRSGSGRPRFWTVTDVIEFDVAPDSDYPYQLSYYPTFPALGAGQATNWVLTNHPNIYLSGCLYNLYTFIQDAENKQHWLTQYKSSVHGVNSAYTSSRFSQGAIAAKVG